ncbi:putative membrane protein YfcA [Azospirillum agricola]|uniref:sulfite exporter TauE/SafE family protein n=1 Tax=Azospirillum agricola TaxID=1720247 RepID=UPI001AE63BD9|nr:sulfite exporter TauE/SafE family protein [Azospirillum agricola]MBP2228655.1 putative membrane protein YfcA [Azospirillum agricola]
MPSHSLPIIAAVALTFLLAGGVKGMIGLGLPTVAMGLLGLVMPPAEAASLLIVPSFVTNVWQLASGPGFGPLLERLWPMMAGVCLGTWVGAGFLASDASGVATMALGIALVLYAILGLSSARLRVPAGSERWMGPLVGLATGLVTAATGVFVIPAVPYLQALALEREELVQALGLSFTVSTVALAAGLAQHGVFAGALVGMSLLALLPSLAGMLLGQWLRLRVRQDTFRRCFFLGLLALGAHLALRPLF